MTFSEGSETEKPSLLVEPAVKEKRGPYPFNAPKKNNIPFTPTQVEAIRSGINPGLTLIVGPPGMFLWKVFLRSLILSVFKVISVSVLSKTTSFPLHRRKWKQSAAGSILDSWTHPDCGTTRCVLWWVILKSMIVLSLSKLILKVPFTRTQVEAIRSSINPGLTLIVGPPGMFLWKVFLRTLIVSVCLEKWYFS